MPTFNKGGQRRTSVCACGYSAKGDVRTSNFKMRLHHKVCKETLAPPSSTSIPFNSANGKVNGWGGLRGSNTTTKSVDQIVRDGEVIGVLVENKITKKTTFKLHVDDDFEEEDC